MKIKNLLAVLTAACLFATSFSAVASEETFQIAIDRFEAKNGDFLILNPPISEKDGFYYLTGELDSQVYSDKEILIFYGKSNGKLFIFSLLKPTLDVAKGDEKYLGFLKRVYDNFVNNASLGKKIRLIAGYSGAKEF